MTLYLEIAEDFVVWDGKAINGKLHPREIEQRWTADELAAVGLYAPAEADPVPEGKRVTATSVARVDGVVKFVDTLEDIPAPVPSDRPLTKRQLRLGLLDNGILVSAVRASIEAAIEDPIEQEKALTWFDFTDLIEWDHPQTQSMLAIAGFTPEEAATMWVSAWDIPA